MICLINMGCNRRWFIIITLKDINKAIILQVKEGLKDTAYSTVTFSSTDIVEEIRRPSFYIKFQKNKTNLMLKNAKERNLELQLFYFTKNRHKSKLEVLEMQDLLSNIFISNLKINDEIFIHIHACDFDENKKDGYLILNIDLYLFEQLEEEGTEMLEELDMDTKIN